jgi:hypothetical protein
MARWLAVLLFVVALAFPAGAGAASKRATLPLPANGDMSIARYVVKTPRPDGVSIRRPSRLGDAIVATAGRRLSRRRHEVTVLLANPVGGGTASQEGETLVELIFKALGPQTVVVVPPVTASDLLTQPPAPKEARTVDRVCDKPPPSRSRRRGSRGSRRFFQSRGSGARRVRALFSPGVCQEGTEAERLAAGDGLRGLGLSVPGCTGTVAADPTDAKQAVAALACTEPTRFVSIRAQGGNEGLNCRGPAGSLCQCGPACAPLPVESSCFFDQDGFDLRSPLEFRTHWERGADVARIRGIWVPQGSPVSDGRYVYLRRVLDTP